MMNHNSKQQGTTKRPLIILLLGILHVVSALVIFGLLFTNIDTFYASQLLEGVPNGLILFSFFFLAVLTLVSGIGMWNAMPWGWWVAAFYYLYAIARSLNALILTVFSGRDFEMMQKYYVKYGVRMLISILLLIYFFTPKVRSHFLVDKKSKKYLIGYLCATLLALIVVANTLAFLAGNDGGGI